eukprot:230876_1
MSRSQWTCTVCTFKNHPSLNECEICESKRDDNPQSTEFIDRDLQFAQNLQSHFNSESPQLTNTSNSSVVCLPHRKSPQTNTHRSPDHVPHLIPQTIHLLQTIHRSPGPVPHLLQTEYADDSSTVLHEPPAKKRRLNEPSPMNRHHYGTYSKQMQVEHEDNQIGIHEESICSAQTIRFGIVKEQHSTPHRDIISIIEHIRAGYRAHHTEISTT